MARMNDIMHRMTGDVAAGFRMKLSEDSQGGSKSTHCNSIRKNDHGWDKLSMNDSEKE